MGEGLNETDEFGRGKVVTAKYFVQIFDRSQEDSSQRLKQHHQDDPLQYFFNFEEHEEND